MERIDLNQVYEVGKAMRELLALSSETAKHWEVRIAADRAVKAIDQLVETYPVLIVCRPALTELRGSKQFWDDLPFEKWSDDPTFLERMQMGTILQAAQKAETVLTAEFQTLATYHAGQKAIYSTPDLIERADGIFPDDVLARLAPRVREEIRQAGRCLAFDNTTAAAFHALRAVEAAMHDYYVAVSKPKPRPKVRLPSWGSYLDALDTAGKDDAGVGRAASLLRQLKDHDRNPIMHPELQLTPNEALTIFEIAQSAIMAMSDRFPARQSAKRHNARMAPASAANPAAP